MDFFTIFGHFKTRVPPRHKLDCIFLLCWPPSFVTAILNFGLHPRKGPLTILVELPLNLGEDVCLEFYGITVVFSCRQ